MRAVVAVVLAAAFAAGCAGNVSDGSHVGAGEALLVDRRIGPALPWSFDVPIYLAPDHAFGATAPGASDAPQVEAIDPLLPNAYVADLHPWQGPVLLTDQPWALVVREAAVVLHYAHETAALVHPQYPETQLAAFLGAEPGTKVIGATAGPPALLPMQEVVARIELALPLGGLVIPATSELWMLPISTYTPMSEAGARGFLLVDSLTAESRVELVGEVVALPASREHEVLHETGAVTGSACLGLDAGEATWEAAFDVPWDAVGLRIELTRTSGEGLEDLDLDVLDGAGTVVARGSTPYGDERVDLFAPNLAAAAAGTWSVRVSACGAQAAEFEVVVTALLPVDAGSPDALNEQPQ